MSTGAPALDGILREARAVGHGQVETLALDGMARRAAESGDLEAARSLLDAADEVAARVGHVPTKAIGSTPPAPAS